MADSSLRFYNTLTRRKEAFAPIDKNNVRIYVCGPTVYDYAHIGNARPIIVFDVLFRLLRQVYGAECVRYVRNITDVDDKINARAARDFPGVPLNKAIRRLTEQTEKQFHADIAALNCLSPTKEPRATENIGKMKQLIERLLANGHAYVAENHVLFNVAAMDKTAGKAANENPLYGQLSKRPLKEMLAGARVEVAAYKRSPMDFVLWKPSAAGEPGWESPCGIKVPGRPGWHIECSAMSMAELLEPFGGGLSCDDPLNNRFDIHGGGLDLIFPHHENEIAQSCCALGDQLMANFWLHNGFLQVEGQKMSKSLGNFITIRQILAIDLPEFNEFVLPEDKIRWAGLAARFSMLQTHYREPLKWTQKRFEEASAELYRWHGTLQKNAKEYGLAPEGAKIPAFVRVGDGMFLELDKAGKPHEVKGVPEEFISALADDLNTPKAIALLRRYYKQGEHAYLIMALALIGILDICFLRPYSLLFVKKADISEENIKAVIERRLDALERRDYATADKLRDDLAQHGIKLRDVKDAATGARRTEWDMD